jgi:hypothetical protein
MVGANRRFGLAYAVGHSFTMPHSHNNFPRVDDIICQLVVMSDVQVTAENAENTEN